MSATSPTLTLKVASPQALSAFEELRRSIAGVKAELAGLGKGPASSMGTGVQRLEAEVAELRAALQATRLENERLAKSIQETSNANVAAKRREVDAVEAAEKRKLQLQLTSAKMTAKAQLDANAAVEASLAKSLAAQEAMRDRALDAQFRAQQRALARNEALNEAARRRNLREQELAARAAGAGTPGLGRSLTRGVAAAGGGMFLTYGQSIPALAAGFAGAATIYGSVREGSEFNYQTAIAGALGGYNAEELANIRRELMKMGTDAVFGPNELAKAMSALEASGVHANEALKVLPVSMKIAQQGEVDLQDASKTLIGVMNQFGLSANDVTKIGDAMSKTAAVTQASMPTLMAALKQMTGLQRYGVDLNSALALIGVLAKQGIVGQSAGTFSRRFIEEMYDPRSLDAQRAMRQLQFNPYNSDGTRRNFRDVQSELISKLQGYDEESRNKLMGTMFDVRSLKSVSSLVTDLKNTFGDLRDQIDESKGALDSFSEHISGETKTLWSEVKSNFQGLMIDTFSSIENPLKGLLKDLRDFFKDQTTRDFLHLIAMIPAGYAEIVHVAADEYRNRPHAITDKNDAAREAARMAAAAAVNPNTSRYLRRPSNFASTLTQQALADRAAELGRTVTPEMLIDVGRMSSATPMFGFDASSLPAAFEASGGKRAPKRFTDKLGFTEEQQLLNAQAAEATAQARREFQRINDDASKTQRLLDVQHQYGLVSEADYNRKIDQLNLQRATDAVSEANTELAILEEFRSKKETAAEKQIIDTRKRDIEAKRDAALREAEYQQNLIKLRREGAEKSADAETQAILRKHVEQGSKFREGLGLKLQAGLRSEVDTAQYNAEFQTRESFAADLRALDEQIAKKAKDGGDNTGEIAKLRERKKLLQETMQDEIRLNGEAARSAQETTRTYEYGRDQVFVQYVDAARNSAEQAREAWSTAFTGMENQLTQAVVHGKATWADFANTIIETLVRIQIRKALAGVVQLFMPTASAADAAYDASGTATVDAVTKAFSQHTGGVVGAEGGLRYVPPSVFGGAPRYHTGGVVGEEMPIIAKRGEGVFTPEQMRRLAPAAPANVTIEVVNKGTPQKVVSTQQRTEGDKLVVTAVVQDLRVNGPLSRALQDTYGVSRKGT